MIGYSVAKFGPFWEVVERRNSAGRLEFIVVDTSPRLHERLPVKVYGPATRAKCEEWASTEAQLYLTIKGTFVTD